MKPLPPNVRAYKQTNVFTENTVPESLKSNHRTKKGSWGKICILSGQLRYHILTYPPEEQVVTTDNPGIIEPQVPHRVEVTEPVTFFVEFYQ